MNIYKISEKNEKNLDRNNIVRMSDVINPNCDPKILEKAVVNADINGWEEKGYAFDYEPDIIAQYAVLNPNCPVYLLEMVLLKFKTDALSYYAVQNSKCPVYLLERILKRGKDDGVSRFAAENPNCPALAKIKWMQLTGRIGQFDPSKHIMESDEKEYKEDPDLQKLRALIK